MAQRGDVGTSSNKHDLHFFESQRDAETDLQMKRLAVMISRSVGQSDSNDSYSDDEVDEWIAAPDYSYDMSRKASQAYNYEKHETFVRVRVSEEEARKNAEQLIESEEMAKKKAERKKAKKKRQKDKKKTENNCDSAGSLIKSRVNSLTSLDSETSARSSRAKTLSFSEEPIEPPVEDVETTDDETLDLNSAFFKGAVKQNNKVIPQKKTFEAVTEKNESAAKNKFIKPEMKKNVPKSHYELGIRSCRFALNNEFWKAIDYLNEAIFIEPSCFRHYLNRSYCYLRVGQYNLALEDALHVKQHTESPDDIAKALAWAGLAYFGLEIYHKAEQCFANNLLYNHKNKWVLRELVLARVLQLTNMGFSQKNALIALQQCSTINDAVVFLTSKNMNDVDSANEVADSNIENYESDEIYVSDDESSTTQLVSELVLTLAEQQCYIDNLQSQNMTAKDKALYATRPYSNASNIPPSTNTSDSNSGFQTVTRYVPKVESTSIASTSKIQHLKAMARDGSIWVGNVKRNITEQSLKEAFMRFGPIQSIRLVPEKFYAFINFKTNIAAMQALSSQTVIKVNGAPLIIKSTIAYFDKNKK